AAQRLHPLLREERLRRGGGGVPAHHLAAPAGERAPALPPPRPGGAVRALLLRPHQLPGLPPAGLAGPPPAVAVLRPLGAVAGAHRPARGGQGPVGWEPRPCVPAGARAGHRGADRAPAALRGPARAAGATLRPLARPLARGGARGQRVQAEPAAAEPL